ncbi:helix-turn-helix domain-containing protein [Virgisporangium aurantiacum]|uniref:helix-turn-helix domain-containing protein n=1 Tax=Virgisporangium aurantiacum TaxID=175570 RepID=UPI00194F3CAD|nr:helix-turn-helix domain-containing protein [Virgisporangium aurantiacum]
MPEADRSTWFRWPQSYRERLPRPELAPYVSCVWVQEVAPDSPPFAFQSVPNGCVEVVCVLGGLPHVVGIQSGLTRELLAPGTVMVGVRFRPGAAAPVLRTSAGELVDLTVACDDLWRGSALPVGELLAAAGSPQEAASLLEAEVLRRVRAATELDPVVRSAVGMLVLDPANAVRTLTTELHISDSQLRRRFMTAVGCPPKVLHRTLRFWGFLALAQSGPRRRRSLAALAGSAGYADQAHLARESVAITGVAPSELLAGIERNCGENHIHAPTYQPLLRARALNGYADLSTL